MGSTRFDRRTPHHVETFKFKPALPFCNGLEASRVESEARVYRVSGQIDYGREMRAHTSKSVSRRGLRGQDNFHVRVQVCEGTTRSATRCRLCAAQ